MQEQKQQISSKPKEQIDDSIIYVGTKHLMNYVQAIVMQISIKKHNEVKVIARGKFINKAVDAAEVAKNRFLEGENKVVIKNVKIDSEKFNKKDESGNERTFNVSSIEITLTKE